MKKKINKDAIVNLSEDGMTVTVESVEEKENIVEAEVTESVSISNDDATNVDNVESDNTDEASTEVETANLGEGEETVNTVEEVATVEDIVNTEDVPNDNTDANVNNDNDVHNDTNDDKDNVLISDLSDIYDTLLSDGKIVPTQKEAFMQLFGSMHSVINLSDDIQVTSQELIKSFFNSAPVIVDLSERGTSNIEEEEKDKLYGIPSSFVTIYRGFKFTDDQIIKAWEKDKNTYHK